VTGAQFSEVDIDLLADYVGGALDGTPDETVVAALVADDPAWRDAYDALTGGMAAVGAELRVMGAGDEPMPADVVRRIDTALAELPPLTGSGPALQERHLVAVPGEGLGAGRTARRERRRGFRRWAAPVAVAAGVVTFAGIGFGGLLPRDDAQDAATSAAGDQRAAPMLERGAGNLDQVIETSGVDYDRAGLTSARSASKRSADSETLSGSAPAAAGGPGVMPHDTSRIPSVLQPLLVRDALLACIAAITAQHGAGPIAPDVVDFASFEGDPALVVRFSAADGDWSWVSGPKCGTPGADADTRYQVRVG
jgi:hypothetical protein